MPELERIAALIATRRRHQANVRNLRLLVGTTKAEIEARQRALDERLMFVVDPNRLAGLCELHQASSDSTARTIALRYESYLRVVANADPDSTNYRVDLDALSPEARPYLLGPFLGLTPGGVSPRLCLKRSRPTNRRLVYVTTAAAVEVATWRQALPKISAWLGGSWSIEASTATSLTLTRRDPLPIVMPFDRAMLRRHALFVGFDTDTHRPVYIPFADLSSGTFVPGASGTGKSSALHLMLRSLFASLDDFAAITIADGKSGVAMARYANLHPKVRVVWEEADLYAVTADLVSVMQARNVAQRERGIDNATSAFIVLVIDELASFVTKPSDDTKSAENKAHAQFLVNLHKLAMRGRSVGIRLILSAQSPVAEQIPPQVRANCQTVIGFRLEVTQNATELFGQFEHLPADPRLLRKGQAIVRNADLGLRCAVQFPLAPLYQPQRCAP